MDGNGTYKYYFEEAIVHHVHPQFIVWCRFPPIFKKNMLFKLYSEIGSFPRIRGKTIKKCIQIRPCSMPAPSFRAMEMSTPLVGG